MRYGEVALRNLEMNVHDGGSTGKLVGVCKSECSVAMLFLRVSTKSERFIETISSAHTQTSCSEASRKEAGSDDFIGDALTSKREDSVYVYRDSRCLMRLLTGGRNSEMI